MAMMSFAQERLWFVERFQPAGAVYNLPLGLRRRSAIFMSMTAAPLTRKRFDAPLALAAMLVVTTMVTLLGACIPLLAPEAADAHGWNVDVIALYAPLTYGAALVINFQGPWLLARFGGIRGNSSAISVKAGTRHRRPTVQATRTRLGPVFGIAVAAINPAAAQVLAPRTSTRSAGLVMWIKQLGIPLGAILAGAVMPLLLSYATWRMAIIDLALASAAMIVGFAPSVRWLNGVAASPPRQDRPLELAKQLIVMPGMAMMVLAAAVFSVMQVCLRTFPPVYLAKDLLLSLAITGLASGASQAAGAIGQVGWAVISDRLLMPHATMAIMGLVMAGITLLVSLAIGRFERPSRQDEIILGAPDESAAQSRIGAARSAHGVTVGTTPRGSAQ
jgi:hypothetical protein